MDKKGRFIFDKRPAKDKELNRLIKLSQLYEEDMKKLFNEFKEFNFKRIIDIGAGTGHTTVLLKKIFPKAEVTYCDISKDLSEYARKLSEDEGVEVHFIQEDILKCDNISGKYDFVFSRFALKHIFNPILAVKNMVSLLNEGGIIQLVDKDVSANIWFPRFPLYKTDYMKALNKYNQGQNRGGDPTIGRKLSYLLSQFGVKKIKVRANGRNLIEDNNKTYRDILVEVYENLLPEMISKGYITEEESNKDIENFKNFLHKKSNLAIVFDFIITGVKTNGAEYNEDRDVSTQYDCRDE